MLRQQDWREKPHDWWNRRVDVRHGVVEQDQVVPKQVCLLRIRAVFDAGTRTLEPNEEFVGVISPMQAQYSVAASNVSGSNVQMSLKRWGQLKTLVRPQPSLRQSCALLAGMTPSAKLHFVNCLTHSRHSTRSGTAKLESYRGRGPTAEWHGYSSALRLVGKYRKRVP